MPTTLEELNQVVQKLVDEKMLSLDGLAALTQVKERARRADERIVQLEQHLDKEKTQANALREIVSERDVEIATLKARESSLEVREKRMHDIEKDAAVALATANAYKHSMQVVFAPNIIRERILSSKITNELVTQNGYSSYVPVTNSDHKETTTQEGYEDPHVGGTKTIL